MTHGNPLNLGGKDISPRIYDTEIKWIKHFCLEIALVTTLILNLAKILNLKILNSKFFYLNCYYSVSSLL